MSKFSKLAVTFLTLLHLNASQQPTAGEIATTEELLRIRATRNIVWVDPLANEPFYRKNQKDEFIVAAKDDDIRANLDNAGTIMGGYLANNKSIPAATVRPDALIALINDANWKRLFVVAENYRKLSKNIMRNCFGGEIYRLRLGAADTVGDTRDIVDIPTLLAAIAPAITAGQAVVRADLPVITDGEKITAEALLNFRRERNFFWLDPRDGQPLYRVNNDNPMQAAKDDDVHANLDNAGTIMGGYLTNPDSKPAATVRPDALTAMLADANWNRLYTLVETARRGENRFMFDCLGNPLYKLTMGGRAQSVDMREIIDIPTLLTAVEAYFPDQSVKPAASSGSVLEEILGEIKETAKKDKEK